MKSKVMFDDDTIKRESVEKIIVEDTMGTDPLADTMQMDPQLLCDSTSITEVTANADHVLTKQETAVEKFEMASQGAKDEVKTRKLITAGLKLARKLVGDANLQLNAALMNFAIMAIMIGGVLNRLKELVTSLKLDWAIWANDNVGFIKIRNRQKFMRIASRLDCHELAYLGVDRLDHICAVTKKADGPEPIKQLFSKYGIDPDPAEEASLEQFKLNVDGAIVCERLEKRGVVLPHAKIKEIITAGRCDSDYIKILVDIKESGGDPERKVDKDLNEEACEPGEQGARQVGDINRLALQLRDTIDYLAQDESDLVCNIDMSIIEELEKRIQLLKHLVGAMPTA